MRRTLDVAWIDRYPGKKVLDLRRGRRTRARAPLARRDAFNDLWRTVPTGPVKSAELLSTERRRKLLGLPQENLLYFLEKTARACSPGSASCSGSCGTSRSIFIPRARPSHERGHRDLRALPDHDPLHEQAGFPTAIFLEFLQSHTNVVFQPDFDNPNFSGFNPYALGFR